MIIRVVSVVFVSCLCRLIIVSWYTVSWCYGVCSVSCYLAQPYFDLAQYMILYLAQPHIMSLFSLITHLSCEGILDVFYLIAFVLGVAAVSIVPLDVTVDSSPCRDW